jgi:protoporphyrinogen oxidase
MMKIGIVGGGVAGLTAAYELGKKGHQVSVFEAGESVGGQARTFPIEGANLEIFYHHLFTNDREIIELIKELGLESQLDWIESKVGFFHGGRIYNFTTPKDLLTFKGLPPLDRLRLAAATLKLMRFDDWQSLENTTAKDWMLRNVGQTAFDTVWGAQLRGKFGDLYDQVSMVWFWGKIHLRVASRQGAGAKESLGYMRGSFQVFLDRLVEKIEQTGGQIQTSAPVKRIVVENGRATAIEASDQRYDFDRIIATVPSPAFLNLVPELPESYSGLLKQVEYQSSICLIMKIKRSLSHIYWLNISDPKSPFVGVIQQTNFISPSVYGGKHVVYVANYLSSTNPLYSMTPEELLQAYLPQLRKINPDFDPSWVEQLWVFREEAAQPVITTGYSKRIAPHATPIEGLYLANTTQIYPEDRGMNYSVRLGQTIAEIVQK